MRVISLSNASSLPYGDTEYTPGPDGVFDLPEPVGRELTTKHASMWVEEVVHLAAMSAAELDKLRDPNYLVQVVADLTKRIAALEAKGTPKAKQAPAKAQAPESGAQAPEDPAAKAEQPDEPEGDGAKKPLSSPRQAPAKKTAAKKTAPAKQAGGDAAS